MNPKRSNFSRKQGVKLTLILFSVLVCVLFSEVLLHFRYRKGAGHWLWRQENYRVAFVEKVNDRRNYSLKKNYTSPQGNLHTNEFGFRLPEIESDSPYFVALGDSVPFGYGVSDSETYPASLNQLTSKHGIQVLNAGVPSYNLRQSYDRLKKEVLEAYPLKPNVVLLQASNDISLFSHFKEKFNADVTWGTHDVNPSYSTPLLPFSALYHYSTSVLRSWQKPTSSTPLNPLTDHRAFIENTKAVLNEIAKDTYASGTALVLISSDPFYYQLSQQELNERLSQWPSYKQYAEQWNGLFLEYNTVLKSFENSGRNIFFLDTRPIFDSTGREGAYIDFIHYSQRGNEVAAKAIYEFLLSKKLL